MSDSGDFGRLQGEATLFFSSAGGVCAASSNRSGSSNFEADEIRPAVGPSIKTTFARTTDDTATGDAVGCVAPPFSVATRAPVAGDASWLSSE
ncbi:hypothetical protein DIPPA_21915 [Diplonema papillatum]|nr:hypothetical protein DIPPA_21915 [Diplonema papillatum]